MKKLILICSLLISSHVLAADFSTPQSTLAYYLDCLNRGDVVAVAFVFHPPVHDFSLKDPVLIEAYSIKEKIIYGQAEVADWNDKGIVPPARLGDIDLQVEEIIKGTPYMFSYLMRNVNGEWKIISHALWGDD